jgi:hypothetical protein
MLGRLMQSLAELAFSVSEREGSCRRPIVNWLSDFQESENL